MKRVISLRKVTSLGMLLGAASIAALIAPISFAQNTESKTAQHHKVKALRKKTASTSAAKPTTPNYNVQRADTNTLYFGLGGGYGTTTWAEIRCHDPLACYSTPQHVAEGGLTGSVFAGYQINPIAAVEFAYTAYPSAHITFGPINVYADRVNQPDFQKMSSSTDTYTVVIKLMAPLTKSQRLRLFIDIGGGVIHRVDILKDEFRFSPAFGVGLLYDITPRIFATVSGSVVLGYGRSDYDAAASYIPTVATGMIQLGYRIKL